MIEDLKKIKNFLDRHVERLFNLKVLIGLFFLLIISYFSIGIYQISTVGVTIDEVAHIGAAYAMSNGVDANLEHPPLMKLMNGQLLKYLPGVVKTEVTPNQYETGRQFLFGNPEVNNILFWSRFLYLCMNSLLLFYLLYISVGLNQFPKLPSAILAILYTFSPSFYSHNYLLTFDVIGSISILMTLISVMLIFRHWSQLSTGEKFKNYLLLAFTFTLALLTKFSNVLLLPFFTLVLIGMIIYYYRRSNLLKIKIILTRVVGLLLFAGIFIYGSYSTTSIPTEFIEDYRVDTYYSGFQPLKNFFMLAFDRSASSDIDSPLWKFVYGTMMTLGRSGDTTSVYLNGVQRFVTFGEFSSFLFWFKENSALYLALLLGLAFILTQLYRHWKKFTSKHKVEYNREFIQKIELNLWKYRLWYFIGLPVLLPVLYNISASRSSLVIGYRHFYPVLITIFFGLAWLLTWATRRNTWWRDGVLISLLLYVLTGLAAVPQNLSYVNFLWNKPKWQLVSDSTLNWGQELQSAYIYLRDENLLNSNNSNRIVHAVFDVPWYTAETYFQVDPNHSQSDANNYRTYIDLTSEDFQSSGYNYLIVDSHIIQKASTSAQAGNKIAKNNLNYIQSNRPIYQNNNVIFIYRNGNSF